MWFIFLFIGFYLLHSYIVYAVFNKIFLRYGMIGVHFAGVLGCILVFGSIVYIKWRYRDEHKRV